MKLTPNAVIKSINVAFALFGLIGIGWVLYKVGEIKDAQVELKETVINLTSFAQTSQARWTALKDYNVGKIDVPVVVPVEPTPSVKSDPITNVLIIRPDPSPVPQPTATPTQTPTPKPPVTKTKTIIKYRNRPTPTPFRLFGKPKKK